MKNFNKIKYIVNRPLNEDLSARKQEDDEVNRIKGDIEDQRREQERQDGMKASGDGGDQQQRAPVNPDGSPVSLDDIKDRMPEKGLDGVGGTGYSKIGIGTHGSEKRKGIIPSLMRGAGHIKSMADVAKKGAPVLPVAEDLYEDEEGNLRRFGKITTASAAGNPYYFEFDHYDKASGQNLVLYGTAPGTNQSGADLQPIALKVKTIVPRDKMDVRPMTAPTDANVQSNFVSEKFDKSGAEDATIRLPGGGTQKGGTIRDAGGRFAAGNQSGVQFDKGPLNPDQIGMNPPSVIPGGNQPPEKINQIAGELATVMTGKPSYGRSSGGGGGGGGTSSYNPPNGPSIQTIRRQYKPEYTKQKDDDRVNIPKNLWYHPSIQRMIKRFIAMNKTNTRIKIGSHYGVLVRSDPGDGDSRLKLVRKIPRTHIPKIFLDDDFIAEIIEFAPVPPGIDPSTAMAAVGLGLVQQMGLPMSAGRKEATTAIATATAGKGNTLSNTSAKGITGKPVAGALANNAPPGNNQITISPPLQIGNKVKQESLLDNDRLDYLIYGLDEGFLDWLGTTLGKGAELAKNMYRRGRIGIKKIARAYEKQTGTKLNDIDYENIMNRVKWILGTQSHEQPEWSGDIKGGPDDVDLDPDNNVDFVGDERPDPEGRPSEPTPEPTPVPSSDESKPDEEYVMKRVARVKSSDRHPNRFKLDIDEVNEKLKQVDQEVDELYNNMTLEQGVESMLKGYKMYDAPKPSPAHMLGITDEPPPEIEIPYNWDTSSKSWRDNPNLNDLAKTMVKNNLWPDLTHHDVLADPIDHWMDLEEPLTHIVDSVEEWIELVGHHHKGRVIRQWLAKELNIPMFTDDQTRVSVGRNDKFEIENTQSALQYLARIAWEQNKINVFLPDYKFNPKHFRSEKYDPFQKDHNMDHNVVPHGNMHTTAYADKQAGQPGKQGNFFDKGSSKPGQFGHELGKKVDAAKKEKQKQKDRDEQKKSRQRRKGRGRGKTRMGGKRLEESFSIIRKLVTGN